MFIHEILLVVASLFLFIGMICLSGAFLSKTSLLLIDICMPIGVVLLIASIIMFVIKILIT